MATPQVRQFSGDIRFWEIGTGDTRTPVIPESSDPSGNQPIECNALTFSYEAGDEIEVLSKRRDSHYNQPIHSDTLPGTTSVSATLLEIPPLILARILFGTGSTATVEAGSATDEEVTVGNVSLPVQLPHRLISESPAVVVKEGETTLTVDTDYVIDHRRGQLIPVSGGAIAKGDTLKVSYSYGAHVATSITGGATPSKSFYITGDMQDRISEENGELRIPKATLTVDGDVDWLSSEPIQCVLAGTCVIADGESAPYTFVAYKATS